MTPVTLIALLSAPGLWTCVNADPLTICQPVAAVCVTASPHEMLATQRDAGEVRITALRGDFADIAWNLIVLRAADAMGLARDRAQRRRQERAMILGSDE